MAATRRGKKDNASSSTPASSSGPHSANAAASAGPAATTTTTAGAPLPIPPLRLQDQLDRAAVSLEQSARDMHRLHNQWRAYLTALSYLVVLLSLHQFHAASSTCLLDVKAFNRQYQEHYEHDHDDESTTNHVLHVIPGTKAVALILYDGAALVLGIVLASALCQWLRLLTAAAAEAASTTSSSTTPPQRGAADFHNPFYLLAHACVPPILGLLYVRDPLGTTCLDGAGAALWLDGMELPTADESRSAAAAATTGWPLALVFHVIVTMSLWFMNRQARQLRNSEKALQELRDELKQSTKAKKKK